MVFDNTSIKEEFQEIINDNNIPFEKLCNKTILVTGATGLIGSNLVRFLIYLNSVKDINLKIIAFIRNRTKAEALFKEELVNSNGLELFEGTVEKLTSFDKKIDYIVHAANPTDSKYFVTNPVETINSSVVGTMNLLNVAKDNGVEGFVYLSSMEVYGEILNEEPIVEMNYGHLNSLSIRNSYPQGKRMCETLVVSYVYEYGLKANIARLGQTFGRGVNLNDNRVFAEFTRCALNNEDIILNTKGRSKRCYLYTADAVSGILTILLCGNYGEAYNLANSNTYCSIYEMATMISKELTNDSIKVYIKENELLSAKYSSEHYYNLDVKKLLSLGWKPKKELPEMFEILLSEFEKQKRSS